MYSVHFCSKTLSFSNVGSFGVGTYTLEYYGSVTLIVNRTMGRCGYGSQLYTQNYESETLRN